jgi:hypothetical protein
MNGLKITAVLMGLLSMGWAPSLRADDFNKETHFTINQPLQVQDTVLAPGDHVLRLTATGSNRTLVSIYDADGIHLEKIVLGFAAYRADGGDPHIITVSQPQGDQAGKLKTWFYPGDNFGVEFADGGSTQSLKSVSNSTGRVINPKDMGQQAGAASSNSSGH